MRAIIFDCDGTLVDSERLGSQVMAEYLAELGFPIELEAALRLFRGAKMANMTAELEARLGTALPEAFVPELRSRIAAAFRRHLRPIAGARPLLEALKVPFCVASSGPREKIELSLSLTGLRAFFADRIYSSYEVGTWKPDPGLFLHAAAALNISPCDCAVVEDSLPGVQAGLAAGMKVFALQMEEPFFTLPDGVQRIRRLDELRSRLGSAFAPPLDGPAD